MFHLANKITSPSISFADQYLLEDILDDICYFIKYPEYSQDAALVYVIINDYLHRKFLKREPHPGEVMNEQATDVEESVIESKVRGDKNFMEYSVRSSLMERRQLNTTRKTYKGITPHFKDVNTREYDASTDISHYSTELSHYPIVIYPLSYPTIHSALPSELSHHP